jgi:hypothetical protein
MLHLAKEILCCCTNQSQPLAGESVAKGCYINWNKQAQDWLNSYGSLWKHKESDVYCPSWLISLAKYFAFVLEVKSKDYY